MVENPISRRHFLAATAAGAGATALTEVAGQLTDTAISRPCFVSTWPFGKTANDVAMTSLAETRALLTAVEQGIKVVERDRSNRSVGDGGTPNAAGVVQLDACIMNGPNHAAGSVAGISGIRHPVSVARRVMEDTPHVLLVGEGARQFALQNGFENVDLLTPETKAAWEQWKQQHSGQESATTGHDTIALVGVDTLGNVAGGCSTSGLGYKLPGRVGDSPILGSGLYVDNEVGAAGATGLGENVMRYCASFMIVEAMRHGLTPLDACVAAIRRIAKTDPLPLAELHINFIAMDRNGRCAAAGTDASFRYAVANDQLSKVLQAEIVE